MNQRNRTELLDALMELQCCYPEWRFGQLIANLAGWADQTVWDIEDDQLLAAVNDHMQSSLQRKQQAPT